MTVLKKEEISNYLTNLIDQASESYNSSSNEDKKAAHKHLIDILEAEKKFLYDSTDDPTLNISLNGLPSVESLSQDVISMKNWDDLEEISRSYDQNLEKKINNSDKYKKTEIESFNKKIKKHKKDLYTKSNFSLDNNEKNFQIKILEEYFVNGLDEYSKTTPVARKIITTDYQVAWNSLLSNTSIEHQILDNSNKNIILKNNTVENKPEKVNSKAVQYMRSDLKKAYLGTLGSTKNASLFLSGFYFAFPTASRVFNDNKSTLDSAGELIGPRVVSEVLPAVIVGSNYGWTGLKYYATTLVATNTTSLIYEWYRSSKKKAEKQIKKENKLKELK